MTTGARHLAFPPLAPLLPEPLLLTTAMVALAATADDDVDEGDGTEVMLVFGMPGIFMCVDTPLLTTLLELGEILSQQNNHRSRVHVCKYLIFPKFAGAVGVGATVMCVCCGTGTVGNRERASVAVVGVVTTAVCTSPDIDETTAPPVAPPPLPPFC